MPDLIAQRDFRRVRQLSFCYLCGRALEESRANRNRDHTPPDSLFAVEDQDFPLILNTHVACNHDQHEMDELTGQLISVLHGRAVPQRDRRLKAMVIEGPGLERPIRGIGIDLKGAIWRWVRGFHSALYGQFLPTDARKYIHAPMPMAFIEAGGIRLEPILPQQHLCVDIVRRNRDAGDLDRLVCRNGKCRFECVWTRLDNGVEMCAFALQIYDWAELGDSVSFPRRGCVGSYSPAAGAPALATFERIRSSEISGRLNAFDS